MTQQRTFPENVSSPTYREELLEAVRGEISHHISPVIGWLRMDAAKGRVDSDQDRLTAFEERLAKAANDVVAAILAAGYRKPRIISTRAEVEALPDGAVIGDSAGDVSEKRDGLWCSYETQPMTDARMSKYLPATVFHEPGQR